MNRLLIGSPDKTSFLAQFLAQEFAGGLSLIDPTGVLAPVAADLLPADYTQRAFYFDPADMTHPAGFNVLENIEPDQRQTLTEHICSYFEAMWPNGWGAQSNFILANCLRVLLDAEGSTMLGVLKLLTDRPYRDALLPHCADPVVSANWRIINAWDKKQEQAAIAPLLNKIGTLLMSPAIRNIVGQTHSTFSLSGNTIVIANLDRARVGDLTAKLLGGLLIARSSGIVYVHDLPFFASDHFASLLPQSRFTVSLKFLDELPKKLQQAVLSIDEKIVLRTNPQDAETLAFYLGIMNPRILTELATDEACTPAGTFAPEPVQSRPRLAPLRRRSRARHTRPRKLVENSISRYFAG